MVQQNQKTTKKEVEAKVGKDKKSKLKVPTAAKTKQSSKIEYDDDTINFGQKLKVINDVSTFDGTLYKDEIVKVESSGTVSDLKVVD